MIYLKKMRLNKNSDKLSIEFLFGSVILISFITDLLFNDFQLQRFYNLIENILFAIVLIIPLVFINNKRLFKIYFFISFFFFCLTVYLETAYYYIFNVNISPSVIYIFFESNNQEAKEFVTLYLDKYLILYALIIITIGIIPISKKKFELKIINRTKFVGFKLVYGFILILIILRITPLRFENLPYLIVKSFYVVYIESKVLEKDFYKSEKGIFEDAETTKNKESKLYVVIIGESTTRNNMSLYGYKRNTNPLLSGRDDLLAYNNVISAHAGTTASITKALSLRNYESSTKQKGSIIQLLNAVNFETYWISNQQPVGWAETDITKLVYSCKNKFYLSTESSEDTRSYDEVVFNKIDDVLEQSVTDTFLFVHLQGTHIYYKNRYPESYNIFKSKVSNSLVKNDSDFDIINEYDNAVLYNDFVVNSIINKINKINKNSFVLYFSDHGEEVFNSINFIGHNDDLGTLPMYEIPFVLWQSEKFKQYKKIENDLNRSYMIDDLFHSIADLCNVKSEFVDVERSIFNSSFKDRKRILLRNRDYDVLKKMKLEETIKK